MLPSFEELLQPTSINMWLVGLPIENGGPVTVRFVFYFINLMLMVLEEVLFVFSKMEADHFLELTALIPCISLGTLCLCKIFSMFLNRKKIVTVLKSLKELYDEILIEDLEIDEVKKMLNFVKSLVKYVFILNQMLTWVYIFIPVVLMAFKWCTRGELTFMLPWDVLLPFAWDTWIPFLVVYIHSSIAAVTTVMYVVAVDTLYCVLVTHICVNFMVLAHKLTKITPDNSHQLVDIVRRHQYLIELSQELEDIFSPSLLLNFVASSIEICTLGFNIVAGDLAKLPSFLLFLASSLVQILLLSMFGDLLITESEGVGHAAYLCEWYNLDSTTKMSLLLIRERCVVLFIEFTQLHYTVYTARRPQKLTAMKFTDISYRSFSKIISTSWSYFTILNTVYSPAVNQ